VQAGPRICIGKELAMIQMKIIVAGLLQHFTFSVPDNFSPTYALSLTLHMKDGLPVTVHARPQQEKQQGS
jgi:cytochrome P450